MTKIFSQAQLQRIKMLLSDLMTQAHKVITGSKEWRDTKANPRECSDLIRNLVKSKRPLIAKLEPIQSKVKYHMTGGAWYPNTEFTQSDLQVLRNIIRKEVYHINISAFVHRKNAQHHWDLSYKGAAYTKPHFDELNLSRTWYRDCKRREKKLVELQRAIRKGEHHALKWERSGADIQNLIQNRVKIDTAQKELMPTSGFDTIVNSTYCFFMKETDYPGVASVQLSRNFYVFWHYIEDGYVNAQVSYYGRKYHVNFPEDTLGDPTRIARENIVFEIRVSEAEDREFDTPLNLQ